MTDVATLLSRLPYTAAVAVAAPKSAGETIVSTGVSKLDANLRGGLAVGAIHEIYAETVADAPAMTGLGLGFTHRLARGRPIVWVRRDFIDTEVGEPYRPGLAGFGLDPSGVTFVRTRTPLETLQAGLEAARCTALGVVLIELWGETKAFDLTASRRLVLAAQGSGVPVVMACAASVPQPSAAETRWRVRAASSRALPANAPGQPAFSVTLLRQRGGAAGQQWYLEWNCDRGCFDGRAEGTALRSTHQPPLPGALVPVSGDRPGTLPAPEGCMGDGFRKTG
jgi:protein ImuA